MGKRLPERVVHLHRCAEQRPAGNGERESMHGLHHIDGLPPPSYGSPYLCQGLHLFDDHRGERRKVFPVKGRLEQSPLPQPRLALVREQALTQQGDQRLVENSLAVILPVTLEDVLHVVRVAHQVNPKTASPVAHYIAEAIPCVEPFGQGLRLHAPQAA